MISKPRKFLRNDPPSGQVTATVLKRGSYRRNYRNVSIITGQLRLRFHGPRHLVGCVVPDSMETATGLFKSGTDVLKAEHFESCGLWLQ
jgi:hypothetical protein